MRRTSLAPRTGGLSTSLRRVLPVVAIGAAIALSACQTQSPVQTEVPYNPADGVPVDLGQVQVRDLVVVGQGRDKAGVISGSVSNNGDSEERVAFALPNESPVYATAPPHSTVRLSEDQQVQLPSVPAAPGDVVTLTVQTASAPSAVASVPVVPASSYYASLAATASPSSSTPESSTTSTTSP
jgi:hypothetical protein